MVKIGARKEVGVEYAEVEFYKQIGADEWAKMMVEGEVLVKLGGVGEDSEEVNVCTITRGEKKRL